MQRIPTSVWKQLSFPGGFLLLAVTCIQMSTRARAAIDPYIFFFYFAVLAVGLVLGALYNRGRTVLALLSITLAAAALTSTRFNGMGSVQMQLLMLLLPATLLLLALVREQGLRAPAILTAALLIATLAASLLVAPHFNTAPIEAMLTVQAVPDVWMQWTMLGQLSLVAFVVALAASAILFCFTRRPTDRALFWAIVAVFFALHAATDAALQISYFAAALLILAVGVFEHAHSVAYVDELTGIPGRRALNEYLPQVLSTMTVAMVDVDHFKKFNDTYGHEAGDQVLRLVARRLAAVRGGGRVFRYGGEEFTIIFPGLSKREAAPFLEAVRANIEEPGFRLRGGDRRSKPHNHRRFANGKTVKVTVSIGVAERNPDRSSADLVVQAADRALYRAKAAGRNQVFLAA